jgi:hypothetical protein
VRGKQLGLAAGLALGALAATRTAGAAPVTYTIQFSDPAFSGSFTIDSANLGFADTVYPLLDGSVSIPGSDPASGRALVLDLSGLVRNDSAGEPIALDAGGGTGGFYSIPIPFDPFYLDVRWGADLALLGDRSFDYRFFVDFGGFDDRSGTYEIVPEPSTLSLLTAGLGLLARRRARHSRSA